MTWQGEARGGMRPLTRADTEARPRLPLAGSTAPASPLQALLTLPSPQWDAPRPPAVLSAHSQGCGAKPGTARPGKAEKERMQQWERPTRAPLPPNTPRGRLKTPGYPTWSPLGTRWWQEEEAEVLGGSGRSSRSPAVKATSGGRQQWMDRTRPPPGSAAILECPSAASPWRQLRGSGLRQWMGGAGAEGTFDWTRAERGGARSWGKAAEGAGWSYRNGTGAPWGPALPQLCLSAAKATAKPCPQRHIHTAFERFLRPPGQPIPMLDHPFCEGIFPNVLLKPLRPFLILSLVTWEKNPTPTWLQPPVTAL